MQTDYIYETVSWQAKPDVVETDMIQAVTDFGHTVKTLPGFLHQALYQNDQGLWMSVYYWKTEDDAKNSNEAVANEPTFLALLELIKVESIEIKLHRPLQQVGELVLNH